MKKHKNFINCNGCEVYVLKIEQPYHPFNKYVERTEIDDARNFVQYHISWAGDKGYGIEGYSHTFDYYNIKKVTIVTNDEQIKGLVRIIDNKMCNVYTMDSYARLNVKLETISA